MGKIRCANCDSVISDGQTQCLSCGSKDFYDEDEKKREEEKKERISKWKNMPKGKKTGIVLAIIGIFVFSIIMGVLFPAEETNSFKKYVYVNEYGEESYFEIDFTNNKYNYNGLDFYFDGYFSNLIDGSEKSISDRSFKYEANANNYKSYELLDTGKSGTFYITFDPDKSQCYFAGKYFKLEN